jgi:hypothetical protein
MDRQFSKTSRTGLGRMELRVFLLPRDGHVGRQVLLSEVWQDDSVMHYEWRMGSRG